MTMHHESQERAPQAVRRLGLYLPPALLLMLALAWCGFWLYSAQRATAELANLKTMEAARGRVWDCADQSIVGFPFRIELHCSSVQLEATPDGGPMRIRTGALHAATQIYAPTLLLADIDGPLTMEANGATSHASWDNLRLSVRFAGQLERLSLTMSKPQIDVAAAAGDRLASAAKGAEFHLRYDPARPADDKAVDLAFQLTELSSPALNALTGTSEKLDMGIAGVASKLADLPPQGWHHLLESWRHAGGVFTVESGKIAKGALQIETQGTLSLDPAHRVQGKLDVSASGIGPLIARFGGGGVTPLLGPLLTRKDGTPVKWPLQMQDGRIQLGPFRTGPVLAPLY